VVASGLRGPSRRSGSSAGSLGTVIPAGREAKMFPSGQRKAALAQPAPRCRAWERSLAARGERSERPVAGTGVVAHADRAGKD
jgi:hypothetical protein